MKLTYRSTFAALLLLVSAACRPGGTGASLTRLSEFTASAKCPAGGVTIATGLDTNQDGTLADGEVTAQSDVCNGTTATNGQPGDAGADGTSGFNTLLNTTIIAAGDPACAAGGVKLEYGLDDGTGGGVARNGQLEPGESFGSRVICNGADATNLYPGSVTPPAGPAGQYTINTSGGAGDAGPGGQGGSVAITIGRGTRGGHLKVFKTGVVDASFSVGATPALIAGSTPMVVNADLTMSSYPTADAGIASGDSYFFVDGEPTPQANVAGMAKDVSSVSVAAGKTLTVLPNQGTYARLFVQHDIKNAGTITTGRLQDGMSAATLQVRASSYYGEPGSTIRLNGTANGLGATGNGGNLDLVAYGRFVNQGAITATGGDGDNGGAGGSVSVHVFPGSLDNTGAIDTRGGAGTLRQGGEGGTVTLQSGVRALRNSGALNSSGGPGAMIGGFAGSINLSIQNIGPLLNSGNLTARGGACTGPDCQGGGSYGIVIQDFGGDLRSSGALDASGAPGTGSGNGGYGGSVSISNRDDRNNYSSTFDFPTGSIFVSGNITSTGGTGGPGGQGGGGGDVAIDLMVFSIPAGQEITLFGYTAVNTAGAASQGTAGGSGGQVRFLNIDDGETNVPNPGGAVINYADLLTRGGSGVMGGSGGSVDMTTQTVRNYRSPLEYVANFANTLDVRGGDGTDGNGGSGGQITFVGTGHCENHAAVLGQGGDARGQQTVTSGRGAWFGLYSDNGPVSNTGVVQLNAGTSTGDGGRGGAAWIYGTVVTNTAAISSNGGNATDNGGPGGEVELGSTPVGTTTNTGALSASGGTGATPGAPGILWIDGSDVGP